MLPLTNHAKGAINKTNIEQKLIIKNKKTKNFKKYKNQNLFKIIN